MVFPESYNNTAADQLTEEDQKLVHDITEAQNAAEDLYNLYATQDGLEYFLGQGTKIGELDE